MNEYAIQEELRLCKKYGCVNIDEVLLKQKKILEDEKNGRKIGFEK